MNIANILKKSAPTLAALIGGPAGAAIGMTAKLASILGQPEDSTQDQIAAALMTAPPETILQVKQLEQETKVRLKELDLRPDELAVSNTQDARAMALKTGVHYQFRIFVVLTLLVFLVVGALFYIALSELTIQQSLMSLLSMILGYIIKAWNDSTQFFNGTSMGSKLKDQKNQPN